MDLTVVITFSCYDGEGEAPRIPKVDVRQSIDQELNKTVKLGKFFGNNPLLTGLSDALEAMREYSSCMNGCIGDKRKNGDCFAASGYDSTTACFCST